MFLSVVIGSVPQSLHYCRASHSFFVLDPATRIGRPSQFTERLISPPDSRNRKRPKSVNQNTQFRMNYLVSCRLPPLLCQTKYSEGPIGTGCVRIPSAGHLPPFAKSIEASRSVGSPCERSLLGESSRENGRSEVVTRRVSGIELSPASGIGTRSDTGLHLRSVLPLTSAQPIDLLESPRKRDCEIP